MIEKFIKRFDAKRTWLSERFTEAHPDDYQAIVRLVIEAIADEESDYRTPDVSRITVIDHGDYQGTMLFVIAATGYQPSTFWAVAVDYGSCSGCDTFESVRSLSYNEKPTQEQVRQYMDMATHILQEMVEIGSDT